MDRSTPGGDRLSAVLDSVRGRVSRQQFETWFRKIDLLEMTPERVVVAVENAFFRDWIQTYYADVLQEACGDIIGGRPEVSVVVSAPSQGPSAPSAGSASLSSRVRKPRATPQRPEPSRSGNLVPDTRFSNFYSDVPLNDAYTFEQFVVGPTNGLAHAAALAVAEKPALSYNPLFLHGSVGLGKTHLLQATCRSVLERRPDLKILYLSCETFANQFIQAVQSGDLKNFRYRYREVDVLVIDDIHFLANKERTQEEFFHTFNQLYHSKRQIILSSDSHPRDIPSIEERLVSRFKWGLVTELEVPGFETRLHIVRMKSEQRGARFPEEVCEFIANQITSNIRELEGAIHKVSSMADLMHRPIDLALAREALRDAMGAARRQVTIDSIVRAVTAHYSVKPVDLQSKKRSRSIAYPRQICMYLARRLTDHSLVEIGGYFGGRDHTTVLYAVDKITRETRIDEELRELLDALSREIRA
ncbi:MAG: chromosomal replication initiator protein DnaA [Planctomycetota bacterium]|jgi:chromosomal replication initiator protein